MDTSESRPEISQKFWNVMLDKDRENKLDWSCEKWKTQRGEEYPTNNKKKEG
jgi:hypothetical protein